MLDVSFSMEIDDQNYDIEINDTTRNNEDQIKRLLNFYCMFLKSRISTGNDPKQEKLLSDIAGSLSDDGVVELIAKIKDEKGQEEVINSVKELMEAYADEDLEDLIDEEINGNLFSYSKSLDIGSVRDKLYSVGNEVKGKR